MSFDLTKFNLDGLDGNTYCWGGFHNELQFFYKRCFGAATVMVWGGLYPEEGLDIALILTRVNSSDFNGVFLVQLLFFRNSTTQHCSFFRRTTWLSTTVVHRRHGLWKAM
ncbi:hypothetical protein Y032_0089g2261 [Ancylostoma ceylanicum]|uniref:Uncharacterized protein n=1 Tax=Ancylostoma ceylanicum TaxID=53326 RepID=A0A016TNC9_9BILA|nr:hypothetical protein Y032_0089g2261 [Ancylostoma ceylanicum]